MAKLPKGVTFTEKAKAGYDRFRGFEFAHLGQYDPGPDQLDGPLDGETRIHRSAERQILQARQEAGGPAGTSARLASSRRAYGSGRGACLRQPVRFRPLCL